LFCFSSVNIFKIKLVVSFCYLSVISDICEPCLGEGGGGYQYPISLKQKRQISHIPEIDFRSKAKNIPKNTQNDNAISHIPVIQRTHIPKNKMANIPYPKAQLLVGTQLILRQKIPNHFQNTRRRYLQDA
jgi:hypothetical protein